jgi:L-amino acid N-acyltransferase YncA
VEGDLEIRPVRQVDAHELSTLLNEIIARGGTTALEDPLEPSTLAGTMLTGPDVICCFVASERSTGKLTGFQTLQKNGMLPGDIGDIGTFARVGLTQKGVGSALFNVMRSEARKRGLTAINATIRADNSGGLAFYHRLGFVDHEVTRAVPLKDGTPVDRISKRYSLRHKDDTEREK